MNQPILNPIQRAWLQEIGIDARMLAHFSMDAYALEADRPAEATPAKQVSVESRAVEQTPAVQAGPVPVAQLLRGSPLKSAPGHEPAPAASPPLQEMAPDASLSELRAHAEHCQACGLYEVRGQVVFGEGVEESPQWMFIGEAPGEYDDTVGRPFQGRAGELLRCMLLSVGITQDGPAYFTNVLKCRPMGNRSPLPDEVAACMPLLRRQIQQLRPNCLVALGRVSASALLGKDADLDELRGQVHSFTDDNGRQIPLVVTHHPASLLLHGQLKAEAWRDFNLLADLRFKPD